MPEPSQSESGNVHQRQPDEGYDWRDDMHQSWLFALETIRARVAAGGPGWNGYGPNKKPPEGG